MRSYHNYTHRLCAIIAATGIVSQDYYFLRFINQISTFCLCTHGFQHFWIAYCCDTCFTGFFTCFCENYKRNIKLLSAALGFLGWLWSIKVTYRRFSVPESQFKNSHQFQFTTSWNCSSLDDGFRLLFSLKPLLRFQLVVSWDLANLGRSSSGIWPFSVSHLPGYGNSR